MTAQLPVFWRYTMYRISPASYLIGGVLSAVLEKVPVICNPTELATFNPPGGQTCGAYAADYLQHAIGYLVNANSTSDCQYCPLSDATGVYLLLPN
jgi:ABC-type multidrug transport system permease subunit